jgi:CubicO group peptidase (beta-lactamase class C family)
VIRCKEAFMKSLSSRFAVYLSLTIALFVTALTIASPLTPRQKDSATPSSEAERIHRIEAGFAPLPSGKDGAPLPIDLPKLMQLYNVPGLSVAVIDNYKIVWAKAYGVTEAGGSAPVTTKTLFQAGSISKPVAATGALALIERGVLSLDEDVNKKLVTWKVPENEFTKEEKVTLRRLMTHSAGLTVHGFPGYPAGAPLPTLVQIFNGEKPANTAPIRVDFVPGAKTRYSGGGITIEQQLMIDVTRKPFPQLMRETVLDKIGMSDSTYEQPLPPASVGLAASGTYAFGNVVAGKRHVYPEMAAAGLWTTPTDLAKFAIEIALSKQGKSNRVLSAAMTREMLKPQIENVGLGFFLGEGKNADQFGHDGADEGFQAMLTMFADSGQGVAIMANSDNGIAVGEELLASIAKEYAWNFKPPQRSSRGLLFLIARASGTQAALDKFSQLKMSAATAKELDEGILNQLGYMYMQSGKIDDAILYFQRNVQEYPQSSNVYDSLGEAYMNAGKKDLAIQNYEKSIQLNPKNQNGVDMLKKLKEGK